MPTEEVNIRVNTEIKKALAEAKEFDSYMTKLSSKAHSVKFATAGLEEARKEIDNMTSTLKSLTSKRNKIISSSDYQEAQKLAREINTVEKEIKDLYSTAGKMRKLDINTEEVEKEIMSLQKKLSDLKIKQIEGGDVLKNMDELDREISKIQKKLEQLKVYVKDEEVQKANQKVQSLGKEVDKVSKKKINISTVTKGITEAMSSLGKLGSQMQNVFTANGNNPIGKFTHFLTKGIGYSTLYRTTSAMMNLMDEGLERAVGRYDTMVRSANVLQNTMLEGGIQIGQEDIERLQTRISDAVEGLPTQLSDAMQYTTDLVGVTRDLDKSADIYQALNDAVVAYAGGSEEAMGNIMSQMTRAIASGKMDGVAFKALTRNGIVQPLAEVASMLGLVQENGAGDLGALQKALSDGTVSVEQFTDAFVKLDKEGSAGLSSLQSIAQGSVNTFSGAMQVLRSRIAKGFESVIRTLNESIGDIFGTDENGIVRDGVYWIKQAGKAFMQQLGTLNEYIQENKPQIQEFLEMVIQKASEVFDKLKQVDWISLFQGAFEGIKTFATDLIGYYKAIFDAFKPILKALGGGSLEKGLAKFASGWVMTSVWFKRLGYYGDLVKKFTNVLSPLVTMFGALGNSASKLSETKVGGFFSKLFGKGKDATNVVDGATNVVEGATQLSAKEQAINGAISSLTNIGVGLARIGAIALEIAMMSTAIKHADKELEGINWGAFAGKMLGLGTVVVAMQGLTQLLGSIVTHLGATEALFGLASMLGAGGSLYLIATGMKQLNEAIPDDTSKFGEKVKQLVFAVTAISGFAGLIGSAEVLTGGVGGAIAVAGLATLGGIAVAIAGLGVSLQQLDKADLSTKNVEQNIKGLNKIVEGLSGLALDNITFNTAQAQNIANAVESLSTMAKSLSKISKNNINVDKAKTNVESMADVINELKDTLSLDTSEGWKPIDVGNIENAEMAIESLEKLPNKLISFQKKMDKVSSKLSKEKLGQYGSKISEVLAYMNAEMLIAGNGKGNAFSNFVKNKDVTNASKSLKSINDIVTYLNEFKKNAKTFKKGAVKDAITEFGDAMAEFGEVDLKDSIKDISESSKDLGQASSAIVSIKDMVTNMSELVTTMSGLRQSYQAGIVATWSEPINEIDSFLQETNKKTGKGEMSIWERASKIGKKIGKGDNNAFKKLKESFSNLAGIATDLNDFTVQMASMRQGYGDRPMADVLFEPIGELNTFLQYSNRKADYNGKSIWDRANTLAKRLGTGDNNSIAILKGTFENLKNLAIALGDFASQMAGMRQAYQGGIAETLFEPLEELNRFFEMSNQKKEYGGKSVWTRANELADKIGGDEGSIATLKASFDNLSLMIKTISDIQTMFAGNEQQAPLDLTSFQTNLRTIFDAIQQLPKKDDDAIKDLADLGSIAGMMEHLKTIVTSFQEMNTSLVAPDTGEGIDLSNLGTQFANIKQALTNLPTKEEIDLENIVDFNALATNLTGISTNISTLVTEFNSIGALTLDENIVNGVIKKVKSVLNTLNTSFSDVPAENGAIPATGATGLRAMVDSIKYAVDTLNSIDFTQNGTNFAQEIVDGFSSVNIEETMVSAVEGALNSIGSLSGRFANVGRALAQALVNGFKSNLNGIAHAVMSSAGMLGGATGSFQSAGVQLGNALINGIQSSLNKGVTVTATVSTKNGVAAPDVSGGIADTIRNAINSMTGGIVPKYLDKGGFLAYMQPKGTDTIPAMLTPGEFVIRKKVVDAYSPDFFERLNNMDVEGAMKLLTRGAIHNTRNAVSYTTINNNSSVYNDNRHVTVHGRNERSQQLKAGRFLRGIV